MSLNLPNSAISFVVALLALSGNAVATPADMNGDPVPVVNTAKQSDKEPLYLSLNHFPSMMAANASERFNLPAAASIYDEEFLESLQEKLSVELDALIEVQGF